MRASPKSATLWVQWFKSYGTPNFQKKYLKKPPKFVFAIFDRSSRRFQKNHCYMSSDLAHTGRQKVGSGYDSPAAHCDVANLALTIKNRKSPFSDLDISVGFNHIRYIFGSQ